MSVILNAIGRSHDADRDRKIERRRLLLHVGGGKVDQHDVHRHGVAAVDDGTIHALDRLLHRRLRKPDDGGLFEAPLADIDFHFAKKGVDAD